MADVDSDSDRETRLGTLKESYHEVLQATKHEDDKIGRFLTAIAFLVAGTLLFSQQEGFFEARYDLGEGWPLPAIAVLGFLFSVVFSVLLYVLTIAAPVTPPPAPRGAPRRSRLFFQLIAEETPETWAGHWAVSAAELRDDLIDQYRNETLNLAYRAYTKRNRSTEATHLFTVGLLFFLLTIALGVHSATHVVSEEPVSNTVPWNLTAELIVAIGLAFFPVAMLYQQWASHMVRHAGLPTEDSAGNEAEAHDRSAGALRRAFRRARQAPAAGIEALGLKGFLVLGGGLGLLAFVLVVFADRGLSPVAGAGVLVAGAAMGVGWWSAQAARRRSAQLALPVVIRLVFVGILMIVAIAALYLERPGAALVAAVVVALSPTVWQLQHSVRAGRLLANQRRRRIENEGPVEGRNYSPS